MDNKMKKAKTGAEWFEELDRLNSEPFLPDREQPVTPKKVIFDEHCPTDILESDH